VIVQAIFPLVLVISPWIIMMVGLAVQIETPRAEEADSARERGPARARRAEKLMRQVVDNNFDAVIHSSGDGTIENLHEPHSGCSATRRPRRSADSSVSWCGLVEVSPSPASRRWMRSFRAR
jgi:hypothetical protein